METKVAWGILGTGNIAHTFAKAVGESRTGRLVAVGSRSQESADKFGNEFNVPHRHASYEELLSNPEVQAVYISTPHPQHAEWAIKTADAGKHILCEKPLTMNYPEAMAVVESALRNDVFLMEAFMYRCHPQTAKLVELIRDGAIGQVRVIQANFSFHGGYNPESRLLNPELGGGGILDVGCYCTSMARLIAGAAQGKEFADPISLEAVGHLGSTGVDEYTTAVLKFPGDILAQLFTGVQVNSDNAVRIYGSEGNILVPSPWFCGPTDGKIKLIVQRKGEAAREEIIEPQSSLYALEVDTVGENIETRRAPSPAPTPEDSLGNMKTLDQWRQAIGLLYPDEKPTAVRSTLNRKPLQARLGHNMPYGKVEGIDKPISRLVMGTMLEGVQMKLPHASAIYDDFIERGGNCFDTAYVYGTEKIVGQWIKNRGIRKDVVVVVKGAHTPYCNPGDLTRQLHESLDHLQSDYADLYMMHRDNLDIPVADFIDELNGHLQAGRVRSFGASNWSIARVEEANRYAQENGLRGFSAVSNNFSLARMVNPVWAGSISTSDPQSRGWFTTTQMPLFAWSSQARGFFVRGNPEYTDDAELVRCWYSEDNFRRLERVQQIAKERGVSPINIALAYVLNQPFPTYALIGPRTLSETRTSLPGLDIELTSEELRRLNLDV
ncbi:MAG TPA: aldo/keto reductase [Abditibacteriaceae bacterium]|jgi:predicted dehydrogenase/aryl-alcohol dehydrogenase-like predicted oxidoreductase